MVLGISSAPSTTQLGPCLIFTIASSVILPLNRLCADDPNKANIITTAGTPKINANFVYQILYYEVYYNIDKNAFKNSCWC